MVTEQNTVYRERQYPRFASFLPIILVIPAVWLVGAPLNTNLGLYLGFAIAATIVGLKIGNSRQITVNEEFLQLGDARIPKKVLGEIKVVPSEEQFLARGAELDARAFVFMKYGLPGLVKIQLVDSKDPTPYLLISTRNPEKLTAALS